LLELGPSILITIIISLRWIVVVGSDRGVVGRGVVGSDRGVVVVGRGVVGRGVVGRGVVGSDRGVVGDVVVNSGWWCGW